MNTLFTSKVVVVGSVSNYSPVEQGYTTLANAILANEYQTTPEISKQKSQPNKQLILVRQHQFLYGMKIKPQV